ncbi:MAG: P-loop NTPase [[Clostridium] scindens]
MRSCQQNNRMAALHLTAPDARMQIPAAAKPQDMKEPANPFSHIGKVIAVVSGKGGVGKSMVTASLARPLDERAGILGRHPGCRYYRAIHTPRDVTAIHEGGQGK